MVRLPAAARTWPPATSTAPMGTSPARSANRACSSASCMKCRSGVGIIHQHSISACARCLLWRIQARSMAYAERWRVNKMKASATYRSGKSSARPKSFRAGWAQAEGGGILFRLLAMGTLIVLVLVGMAFYRSILGTLGSWLVVQEPPARADAIIVLSGDSPRAPRAARAAALYRAGWAPVVVASGTALRSYF